MLPPSQLSSDFENPNPNPTQMLPPSQLSSDFPKPNPNPNPTEMAAPSISQVVFSHGRTTEELSAPPSYERVVPSFPCPSPIPWTITDEFLESSAARETKTQDYSVKMPWKPTDFPDRIPEGRPAMPNLNRNVTCQICGAADHHTAACSYLVEIPRGAKIINETQFKIVCQCGKLLVDGACNEGCPPHIPLKVISTPFSWLTYTPIKNEHCRVTFTELSAACGKSNRQDRRPKGMPETTTAFPDRIPEGRPAMPNLNLNVTCKICGAADHHTAACSYLWEIPRGAKIIDEAHFKIVCQCGQLLVDGACNDGCPPHIPFKVISTPFSWLTYTPINKEHCRVTFTELSAACGESNRQDRRPKGMPETTTAFPDRIPEAGPAMPNLNLNVTCQICGAADHHTAACSYLWEIPRGAKIIDETHFKIVCQCGQLLVDGACSEGCPAHIPLKVISTPFSWPTYTPIKNEHCRVTFPK